MNETKMRQRLLADGYTWEEAEDRISDYAEDLVDAARDREVEEYFQTQGESK